MLTVFPSAKENSLVPLTLTPVLVLPEAVIVPLPDKVNVALSSTVIALPLSIVLVIVLPFKLSVIPLPVTSKPVVSLASTVTAASSVTVAPSAAASIAFCSVV